MKIVDTAAPTAPGLYHMSAPDYHKDCAPEPSLSSSIANLIVERSPWHAWTQHPRLGGTYEDDPTRQKEVGTAAHKLLLGRGAEIVVIDADSYKGGAAKEKRAEAYLLNLAPILKPDHEKVEAMVDAAQQQLAEFRDLVALVEGSGHSEVVALWREGEAWCRSMSDWLAPGFTIRADYKTTTASAHPAAVARRLLGSGADLQDRFYRRGERALGLPVERSLFIMQETEPPYALSVVELGEAAAVHGDKRCCAALALWQRCMAEGKWPGYPAAVGQVELPGWAENDWLQRELNDEALASLDTGRLWLPAQEREAEDLRGAM